MLDMSFKVLERIKSFLFICYLKIRFLNRIKIGKNVIFRKFVLVRIEKGANLIIHDNCFFNNYCSINCMKKIEIGNNNLFGENVKIYDHDHKINVINRAKKFNFGEIVIGNNNWFGSNCVILRKGQIGNNNVFSCNSIINFEIGDNFLVRSVSELKKEKIEYK